MWTSLHRGHTDGLSVEQNCVSKEERMEGHPQAMKFAGWGVGTGSGWETACTAAPHLSTQLPLSDSLAPWGENHPLTL